MADPRVERVALLRIGLVVVSLWTGTAASQPARAQQAGGKAIDGSVTFTQPLTAGTPGDLANRIVLDPSPRTLAPWATLGFRWAWNASADREAYPTGTLGLRFRRQSVRVALGVSRDAAYGPIGGRRGSSPLPPQTPTTPPDDLSDTVSGIVTPTPDEPAPADNGAGSAGAGYTMQSVTDVTASAAWSAGRMAVDVETGWRLAGPTSRRMWYSATVAAPLMPMLALLLGVDRRHDRAFRPGATRMTLGLQWRWALRGRRSPAEPKRTPRDSVASAPSSTLDEGGVVVHRLPSGIRLSLSRAGAHRVEVRSDLTGWVAVSMERAVVGKWQLDLAAGPGVHWLATRVDGGAWLPPVGLPAGPDGYGGKVGLLIVQP